MMMMMMMMMRSRFALDPCVVFSFFSDRKSSPPNAVTSVRADE